MRARRYMTIASASRSLEVNSDNDRPRSRLVSRATQSTGLTQEEQMKRRMFILGSIVFCFAASTASAADVFSGTWKANLAKSKYDPGPPPKGPNFTKIEAVDGGLKFTNDGVNAEGKPTHSEW